MLGKLGFLVLTLVWSVHGNFELSKIPSLADTSQIVCPTYSATNTNSSHINYASCSFNACGGTNITVSGCGQCTGDQYLALYLPGNSTALISEDEGCGTTGGCAKFSYTILGPNTTCVDYVVNEGCYNAETCSGTVTITGDGIDPIPAPTWSPTSAYPTVAPTSRPSMPTTVPTGQPSNPTQLPSTVKPSTIRPIRSPSNSPVFVCPQYSGSNTNYATKNYASCSFYACYGDSLTVSGCGRCAGDQYLTLFSENSKTDVAYDDDSGCGVYATCSLMNYYAPYSSSFQCGYYSVREGCVGNSSCLGTVTVTGSTGGQVVLLPTAQPTVSPGNAFKESMSAGTVAGIVVCSLFALILMFAIAASFGYVSLQWMVLSGSADLMPQKDRGEKPSVGVVTNPIQPAFGEDLEEPEPKEVVTVQPGRSSLQQALVSNESVGLGDVASSKEQQENESNYQVIITAEERNLFGFPGLKVNPQIYGLVTLATQLFSVMSFLMSYIFSDPADNPLGNSLLLSFIYVVVVSWIAVPIWQLYSIYDKEDKSVDCEGNGCIYCRACGMGCELACVGSTYGKHFVSRNDRACRYIPLSLFNLWFMMRNPGKQLNPELPEDMTEFGFGRGYFLLISLNVRGYLNFYVFLNAVLKLNFAQVNGFNGSTMFAVMSLCFATLNLKVFFMSMFFGLMLLPFTYTVMLMMCCTDCCGLIERLKSKKGSKDYDNFVWIWEHVKKF